MKKWHAVTVPTVDALERRLQAIEDEYRSTIVGVTSVAGPFGAQWTISWTIVYYTYEKEAV
jgi:hypothetical protein